MSGPGCRKRSAGRTSPTDYTLQLSGAETDTTYTVEAVPKGSQDSRDTLCKTLSINQAGTKGESGSAAAPPSAGSPVRIDAGGMRIARRMSAGIAPLVSALDC